MDGGRRGSVRQGNSVHEGTISLRGELELLNQKTRTEDDGKELREYTHRSTFMYAERLYPAYSTMRNHSGNGYYFFSSQSRIY